MARLALLVILSVLVAACAGRTGEWPSLAPRAGEVSPMVPRNVPGLARCPQPADCAPPAPASAGAPATAAPATASPLPPPAAAPTPAEIEAELAAIDAIASAVEQAAAPLRQRRDAAQAAAAGSAPDSAAAATAEQADAAYQAALVPLSDAAFRLEALAARLADAPPAPALTARLRDLQLRIAALAP